MRVSFKLEMGEKGEKWSRLTGRDGAWACRETNMTRMAVEAVEGGTSERAEEREEGKAWCGIGGGG